LSPFFTFIYESKLHFTSFVVSVKLTSVEYYKQLHKANVQTKPLYNMGMHVIVFIVHNLEELTGAKCEGRMILYPLSVEPFLSQCRMTLAAWNDGRVSSPDNKKRHVLN
jgi:hypothetical protein